MSAKDRTPNFREADRKHAELVRKWEAGAITDEEFDAERKRLMILDGQGRWWAKSRKSGEWSRYDSEKWVPGTPPGYEEQPTSGGAKGGAGGGRRVGADESRRVEGAAREVVADGDEGRRSRTSFRRPILIAAFLLVVLLGGAAYALTRETTLTSGTGGMGVTGAPEVAAPDIVGASSVEEAREMAGGEFEVVEAKNVESERPIGAVVSQEPESGESLSEGATIFVDVSKGARVPGVEGEKRDEAVRILEGAGFEVEEKVEESSGENEGIATGQSPEGGEFAGAGSSVGINVGAGPDGVKGSDAGGSEAGGGGDGNAVAEASAPERSPGQASAPDGRIPVPDVIGEKVGKAEETLEDAGFLAEVETVESEKPEGTVVWTDPDPGVLLDPASRKVDLGASSGPPESLPETQPESRPETPESPPESPPEEQYTPPDGEG